MKGPRASWEAPPPGLELEAAEKLILRWDSPSSSSSAAVEERDSMLFDGGDRSHAEKYLRAVDEIRRSVKDPIAVVGSPRRLSSSSSSNSSSPESALQIAMARLEDEFRHVLQTRASDYDIDFLVDLGSVFLKSVGSGSADFTDACVVGVDQSEGDGSLSPAAATAASVHGGDCSTLRRNKYQSTPSILQLDLLPEDAVQDLRSIAERMVAAGYGRECVQVYGAARKVAVEHCFRQLGVEKLSIGDVQRLDWDVVEAKIRRWIGSARVCVRIIFASERRLCERVFEGLPVAAAGTGAPGITDDGPFHETVKGAAIQLFGFADAISIGRRTPDKLFKILDLHDAISDLLPDVATVFRFKSSDLIYTQVVETLSRLAEAVRGILSEFENAVLRDPSKVPAGGTIHPLTRYVMNYLSLMSDYKPTLFELIVTKPSGSSRFAGDDVTAANALVTQEIDFPESENQTPLASHFMWIIAVLFHNLDNKSSLYKDAPLLHLFMMNNVHYIVHKVRDSPELRQMVCDEYLKKLMGKYRQSATSYERATWIKILHWLRDEGLHSSKSFSSGVSKSLLRDRFKSFNAAYEEAHRTQATWFVPDMQLREELRISISEKLLPAYRSFLGRFGQHIESGRHPELYIKYSVEDLETALSDFFEGCPVVIHGRRRSHSFA